MRNTKDSDWFEQEWRTLMSRSKVIQDAYRELDRAKELWPTWPSTKPDTTWALCIIQEELGEAIAAMNDYRNFSKKWFITRVTIRDELIQTIAMCIRTIENLPYD